MVVNGNQRPSLIQICRHAPFGAVLVNGLGQIQYINDQAFKDLSIPEGQGVEGQPLIEFFAESEKPVFRKMLQGLSEDPAQPGSGIFPLKDSDGKPRQFIFYGRAIQDGDGDEQGLVFYLFPVDKTRDFLNAGAGSQPDSREAGDHHQYKTVFEYSSMGFAIINEELIFFDMNQVFADFFNLDRNEARGKHYRQVFEGNALEKFETLLEHVFGGGHSFGKDILSSHTVGGARRILELSLTRMFKQHPRENLMLLIVEDVTSQQDTHKALIQSEKLALTGRLAASLAHEINNPLQTSIGCLGLAEEMLGEDDKELGVYLQMAIEELQRSARIVKRLRDLNRNTDEGDKEPVDLKELLDGVLLLTKKRLLDRNIIIDFPYMGERQIVNASNDQLQQVFLNVVMNAIDALPQGGHIYFDIVETADPYGVEINIRDTGIGMAPEAFEHIFDPFYTTKEDGLGLGLFICRKIIDDHEGRLSVESQPGFGTEVSIWLPKIEPSQEEGH